MKVQDVVKKMLIKPREMTIQEGMYQKQTRVCAGQDISKDVYLFGLAGIKEKCVTEEIDGLYYYILGNLNVAELKAPKFKDDEAYRMQIYINAVAITSTTKKGLDNGLKSYIRLIGELDSIPCLTIQDMPSTSFRGIHLCIFDPKDGTEKEDSSFASVQKLLKTAALSGYNHAIIEFWGMFPYQRNPFACWKHSDYTMDKVKKLIDFAIDDLHITPVPCQNMTSHAGWSRISSRRHVSLDQRPDLADMWVPGGWCFAVTNPKTQKFLKDCMEELLAAFRNPPIFHVSCDKCFGFASTEEERTKPADALFVAHLSNLNTFLQEHGSRMVMWGDMVYSSSDSLYWKPSKDIADQLPKNILMNIWTHNVVGDHWHDVDFYQEKGYQTIYSPFINRDSISQMNQLCHKSKSHGILQTTWHKPQTALPYVLYNAACQWQQTQTEACETLEQAFISKWYQL